MKIASGVEMLSLSSELANGPGITHPTVLWDQEDVILVDAGLPGQLPQFRDEAEKYGIPFEKLSKIIITHSDMDHIGGLSSFISEFPQKIEVLAHAEEKPYIQCEKPPIRLAQMEAILASLQGNQHVQMKMLYDNLKANYHKFSVKVGRTVSDGEKLPYCGGIEIIYTPGHTPGHICLYLKQNKILIAGDVLNVDHGSLMPSPDAITLDKISAENSLKKLTQYDIETVICYHGGVYGKNVNHRMMELSGK